MIETEQLPQDAGQSESWNLARGPSSRLAERDAHAPLLQELVAGLQMSLNASSTTAGSMRTKTWLHRMARSPDILSSCFLWLRDSIGHHLSRLSTYISGAQRVFLTPRNPLVASFLRQRYRLFSLLPSSHHVT